jgi:hypothetical protein
VLERVDAWCRRGDFTVEDLAVYRIIYGLIMLVTLPGYGKIALRPESQFDPPPGPIMLVPSVPPRAVLESLELVVAVLVVFLILGVHTKATSLLLVTALMTGAGLNYSFGKIDHGIFTLLVPGVMAFSGWGGAMSVDAHVAARSGRPRTDAKQWAVRLLAFMIGLSFLTAGLAKVQAGWLEIHTHAARAQFVQGYVRDGRDHLLAPTMLRVHDIGILWEALDWFTVALECGLIVSVLWWRTFRIAIAFGAMFHLGVLLVMNIQFSANVIAYGAFVRWGLLLRVRRGFSLHLNRTIATLVGLLGGVTLYAAHNTDLNRYFPPLGGRLVYLGAAVAVSYLVRQLWIGARAIRGHPPRGASPA